MTQEAPRLYTSGDLRIRPERGEICNSQGEVERLTPVNSKVLHVLLTRSGQLVSRSELFDAVWTNQVLNDDVLTRSVSDIRAALRRLSGSDGHIETVPKRGYIWVAEADTTGQPDSTDQPNCIGTSPAGRRVRTVRENAVLVWVRRGFGYAES